jgi:PAS domain S-box-containing protein
MDHRRIAIVAQDEGSQQQLGRSLVHLGYSIAANAASLADVQDALTVADLVLIESGTDDASNAAQRAAVRDQCPLPVVFIGTHAPSWAAGPDASIMHGVLTRPYSSRELQCAIELAVSRSDTSRAVDAAEQRFFDNAIDLLCHLDFSGYFQRLNPAWERTLGFTRRELMARPFIEFVHPDDRERTLAQNRMVRSGDEARAFENRYRCRDGSYRWLRWNAAPDPSHRTIYSVARDVTVEKAAAADRDALFALLETAMAEVKKLQDILPICSYCRRVRDDENAWHSVETYLAVHTSARLSHGICPSCMASEMEPQIQALENGDTPEA